MRLKKRTKYEPVDWNVRSGADVERIVLVVAELVRVRRSAFASGENFPSLNNNNNKISIISYLLNKKEEEEDDDEKKINIMKINK